MDSETQDVALTHAWSTHGYLNNYIQLADAKAGVLMAFSSASIIGILKSKCFADTADLANTGHVALCLLSVCFFCCILVVTPRLFTWKQLKEKIPGLRNKLTGTPDDRSTIFWIGILSHKEPKNFLAAISSLEKNGFLREVAYHNFELSAVLNRKYKWLKFAFWFFALGIIFLAVFFALNGLDLTSAD